MECSTARNGNVARSNSERSETRSESEVSRSSLRFITRRKLSMLHHKMDTEKFIQSVKDCPVLYNIQHKDFKNCTYKTEVWEQLAKEMDESSEVLRTKWKGLKDGYTKYKKWKLYRTESAKSFSNWCWGPYLEFLYPYTNTRKWRGLSNKTVKNSSYYVEMSQDDSIRDSTGDIQETDNTFDTEDAVNEFDIKLEPSTYAGSMPSSSRSQSQMSLRDPIPTETDDKMKLLSFMRAQRSKGIDSVDLLFMSYADSFRKMSVMTQSKLKVKMATIFAEAELEEHNSSQN